jgi:hypothetical protein
MTASPDSSATQGRGPSSPRGGHCPARLGGAEAQAWTHPCRSRWALPDDRRFHGIRSVERYRAPTDTRGTSRRSQGRGSARSSSAPRSWRPGHRSAVCDLWTSPASRSPPGTSIKPCPCRTWTASRPRTCSAATSRRQEANRVGRDGACRLRAACNAPAVSGGRRRPPAPT